ncbi:MAG: LUD domain-containing protein [Hyphomicrobiaceae bacterium]|jgi:L-lactate dehydrogenase complex protein LldG|nr:LUD domain-containing protein [Hyphomicrobiaceae bacterium]
MIPSSRDVVLGRIRNALGPDRAARANAAVQRRSDIPVWTRPVFLDDDTERFIAKAEASFCTVERLASINGAGEAVERLLAVRGPDRDLSIAPSLIKMPWPQSWKINFGAGRLIEKVSITDALAGIAETGSLVFCSEASRPASLNFLPELHIAVLRRCDIVHHLEDIWPKVRALPVWPRAVNIVSAPSRTADVAQIVVRPAHGPKALHILLVEELP